MMVHSTDEILVWLCDNPLVDSVLRSALRNPNWEPEIEWDGDGNNWRVRAKCRSGRQIIVRVLPHPATGDPYRFYRESEIPGGKD
jgi:hypothetical protein